MLVFKSLQIEGTTILVEAANSKHVLYQPTCGELGSEETNIKLPFLAVPSSYHQRIQLQLTSHAHQSSFSTAILQPTPCPISRSLHPSECLQSFLFCLLSVFPSHPKSLVWLSAPTRSSALLPPPLQSPTLGLPSSPAVSAYPPEAPRPGSLPAHPAALKLAPH